MRQFTTQPRLAAASGLLGAGLLAAYFATPAFTSYPIGGDTPAHLASYALGHSSLFYAGAWLQSTGTLLCVVFFLAVVYFAGSLDRLAGVLVAVAATSLLAVTLVESAFLVAVPMAAAGGDLAAVSTTFGLSNGAFVRVFPLAPATATYLALGWVILSRGVLARPFGYAALVIGAAFELGGIAAIFSSWAAGAVGVLGAAQAAWIVAASIATWRLKA